ncbi:hypothetical protein E3C22_07290 [Jiella endophytica]|uniref:Uncharacterized protein n=1 Tax=Jiella endophytica TaxID=2558362 RepID=A0A4Y8RR64_9HYPH|nr:hypothetical protein [Jiella endophytica]TFF25177.1 hypothetical protein E3C22_07290 [Jiella endophytica]
MRPLTCLARGWNCRTPSIVIGFSSWRASDEDWRRRLLATPDAAEQDKTSMLFLVSGMPSAYSRFGFMTVRAIAQAVHGGIDAMQFARLEKFYQAYKNRKKDGFVAFINPGDQRIPKLLQQTQSKVVLFDDDLSHAVATVMARQKKEFRSAMRVAIMASTNVAIFSRMTSAVVYPQPGPNALLLPFIQSLAWFHGVEPDSELVEKVRVFLDLGAITPRTTIREALRSYSSEFDDVDGILDGLDAQELEILQTLRQSYPGCLNPESRVPMRWPARALFDPIHRDMPLETPIQMLGKARMLASGPAYHLPPGEWIAQVVIEVNGNFSQNKLSMQILEDKKVRGELDLDLPAKGRLALTQAFVVEDPSKQISFAFEMKEGAIEGEFSVESLQLRNIRQIEAI